MLDTLGLKGGFPLGIFLTGEVCSRVGDLTCGSSNIPGELSADNFLACTGVVAIELSRLSLINTLFAIYILRVDDDE